MTDDQQHQFIKDLLAESYEGLDRFDREMLELEQGRGGAEGLASIFRIIHTLKGTSGCLGLKRIQKLAHAGESLMDLIRNGRLAMSRENTTALLALSDGLRSLLTTLERTGVEAVGEDAELIERLRLLQTPVPAAAAAAFGLFEDEGPAVPDATSMRAATDTVALAAPATGSAKPVIEKGPAAAGEPAPANAPVSSASHVTAGETAIRVDISQLDRLMNLVGELVLARNQIVQASTAESSAGAAAQRLDLITSELQESVMKTRMQPIGNVWAKYPRIVRDVSLELGKRVRLEMEGQETELDRTLIEAIKDPLTHIVRNSIDHGIEAPAARRAAGKSEEGILHLRAFHEGGQVNIEVSDDGAGIDAGRVKSKAVEKGLISQAQADRMSEREAMNLIFLPGLSTAERITNVSGRGVGMDVVKTNIERVGGSVDVESSRGEGTTLHLKIPLTLAIIPALVVVSAGERFAIPQVSLVELVRIEPAREIEHVFNAPVYRLRGRLLPLVDLAGLLRLERPSESKKEGRPASLVVLRAGMQEFGLLVDTVNDTQEIVVKPLGSHLKGLALFAGATIMGDGRVSLILDVSGLARHAHVVASSAESSPAESKTADTAASSEAGARQSLLIFSIGSGARLAMSLSNVGRLEKVAVSLIEREGPREVVQYRGEILPLVRLSEILGLRTAPADGNEIPVVVCRSGGRAYGLVVGRIEDVVDEAVTVRAQRQRPGVLGSVVIQGRVTELVDVPAVLAAASS